jgi:hypothetical protein
LLLELPGLRFCFSCLDLSVGDEYEDVSPISTMTHQCNTEVTLSVLSNDGAMFRLQNGNVYKLFQKYSSGVLLGVVV